MPSLFYIFLLFGLALLIGASPVDPVEHRVQVRATTPPPPNPTPTACANGGVLVLVARGTDPLVPEQLTPTNVDPRYAAIGGNLSSVVVAATSAGGHNSFFTAIPYPAAPGLGYKTSLQRGIITTKNIVKNYVAKCGNDSKVVVVGYSQGAQVMSSALAGGDGEDGLNTEGYANNIVAGAIFADPSFVYPGAVDAGNATTSGRITSRFKTPAQEQALNAVYAGRLKSYCAADDKYCASGIGKKAMEIHVEEVGIYYMQAISYITPLIQKATS